MERTKMNVQETSYDLERNTSVSWELPLHVKSCRSDSHQANGDCRAFTLQQRLRTSLIIGQFPIQNLILKVFDVIPTIAGLSSST
jgi:hypothetical protein